MKLIKSFIICLLLNTMAFASFVTDFVKEMDDAIGYQYYESQERVYLTYGGISLRSKNTSYNPISITPPRLDVGCNGIDVYTGGISFLRGDQLKEVFNDLANPSTYTYVALSAAFKQALPDAADTVTDVMDYIQKLNSMQLDSCGIAQGAVQVVTAGGVDDMYAAAKQQGTRVLDAVKWGKKDTLDQAHKDDNKAEKDKHVDKLNFSGKEYFKNGGSLLHYIFSEWIKADQDSYTFAFPSKINENYMRALYGDIFYDASSGALAIIKACEADLNLLSTSIFTKNIGINENCIKTTENIRKYTDEQVDAYITALTDSNSGYNVDIKFVKAISNTSLLTQLKADAGTNVEYLKSNANFYKYLAAIEFTYQYTNIYLKDFESTLNKFRQEAAINGGDYGAQLSAAIEELQKEIRNEQNKRYIEYLNLTTQAPEYLINKHTLEKMSQREINKLMNLWR